jgi:Domain of unknown function (DUF4157)
MSNRSPATITTKEKSSVMPMRSSLIQRKCACGNSAGMAGECSDCQNKSLVQRKSIDQDSSFEVPPITHEFPIQTKLTVGTPGDIYEQEADRVADQVMRIPESSIQSQMESKENENEGMIQRKAITNQVDPLASTQSSSEVPFVVHEALHSPGQPLDPTTRTFMEPRFGYDFSQVRVHTDAKAAKSSTSIKARAFTSGQDIFFQQGEYKPHSRVGQKLLAHELTHVVQQKNVRQSEQIQCAPADGSEEPSIASTSNEAIEMWKDVIAERHFQGKGSEGNITFARLKIVDKEGRTVVNILAESDTSSHAEEKAISMARKQIDEKQKFEGGTIIFVTDQTVCDKPEGCRFKIIEFAEKLEVKNATASIITRPALPDELKNGPIAGPKATAKKVQQKAVGELKLIVSTETIYSKLPGGGTSTPTTPAKIIPPTASQAKQPVTHTKTKPTPVSTKPEVTLPEKTTRKADPPAKATPPKKQPPSKQKAVNPSQNEASSKPSPTKPNVETSSHDTGSAPKAIGAVSSAATRAISTAFQQFNAKAMKIANDNPEYKDLITALNYLDKALDVKSFLHNPTGYMGQTIKTELIQGVFEHFSKSLYIARQTFIEKFPDVSTLHTSVSLQGYEKAYNEAVSALRLPDARKSMLYAFVIIGSGANEKTPDKEIEQIIGIANEMSKRLPGLGESVKKYKVAKDSYEFIMSAVLNRLNVLSDEWAKQPAGFADEFLRRSNVLFSVGYALNDLFNQIMKSGMIVIGPVEAFAIDLLMLSEGFSRLGHQFYEFANLAAHRKGEYDQEIKQLEARHAKVQADSVRPF